jgi:DNA-binding MarR family transcriptional regulator
MKPKAIRPHEEEHVQQALAEVLGVPDLVAFDIVRTLFQVGNLIERAGGHPLKDGNLSSARLRLLVRLVVTERLGQPEGLSPTMLSRCHHVSRNTVSALLRGLEQQGLIERAVDTEDRRRFYIRLTPAGREVALVQAPRFAAHINYLFATLTAKEREALLRLLGKVRDALLDICQGGPDNRERE